MNTINGLEYLADSIMDTNCVLSPSSIAVKGMDEVTRGVKSILGTHGRGIKRISADFF